MLIPIGLLDAFDEIDSVTFIAGKHVFEGKVTFPDFFKQITVDIPPIPDGMNLISYLNILW
jgi:hypothetical protein